MPSTRRGRARAVVASTRLDATAGRSELPSQRIERRERFAFLERPSYLPETGLKSAPIYELGIEPAKSRAQTVLGVLRFPLLSILVAQFRDQVHEVADATMIAIAGLSSQPKRDIRPG